MSQTSQLVYLTCIFRIILIFDSNFLFAALLLISTQHTALTLTHQDLYFHIEPVQQYLLRTILGRIRNYRTILGRIRNYNIIMHT